MKPTGQYIIFCITCKNGVLTKYTLDIWKLRSTATHSRGNNTEFRHQHRQLWNKNFMFSKSYLLVPSEENIGNSGLNSGVLGPQLFPKRFVTSNRSDFDQSTDLILCCLIIIHGTPGSSQCWLTPIFAKLQIPEFSVITKLMREQKSSYLEMARLAKISLILKSEYTPQHFCFEQIFSADLFPGKQWQKSSPATFLHVKFQCKRRKHVYGNSQSWLFQF